MLIGALGCNLAWGTIDAVIYLLGCLVEKGRNLKVYRAVHKTATPERAQRLIADVLPPLVASILRPEELVAISSRLRQLPEPPARVRLHRSDVLGALGVFLLVFLSTFPVAIPFLVIHNAGLALRASNVVAVLMPFAVGFAIGRLVGGRPLMNGVAMVVLGVALVALTLALGG